MPCIGAHSNHLTFHYVVTGVPAPTISKWSIEIGEFKFQIERGCPAFHRLEGCSEVRCAVQRGCVASSLSSLGPTPQPWPMSVANRIPIDEVRSRTMCLHGVFTIARILNAAREFGGMISLRNSEKCICIQITKLNIFYDFFFLLSLSFSPPNHTSVSVMSYLSHLIAVRFVITLSTCNV